MKDASNPIGLTALRFVEPTAESPQFLEPFDSDLVRALKKARLDYDFASDFAYHSALSPQGDKLALFHISGMITVHKTPSLAIVNALPLEEQPCFDDIDPKLLLDLSVKDSFLKSEDIGYFV